MTTTKLIPIKSIKGNPKNPRIIKDDKFQKLVKSLQNFPEMATVRPVVCNTDMVILGGNMRWKAAIEAGWKEMPVTVVDWPEDKQQEFIIKDNVSGGEWNWDDLANEWDVDLLNEWGLDLPDFSIGEEPEAEEDDYEVPDEIETDIVEGDLFEIGDHRLLCGDSTSVDAVERLMDGQKADMVFTDPPYNINYQGVTDKRKVVNDKMSDEDFVQFLYDALNIDCDTYYVCCSWQYSHLFREALENLQKPVKSFIVWDKVNPAQNLDKYYKQHEIILYHGKFGGEKTIRGDVWEVKRERNTVHPTMKPIELISLAIKDNPKKKNIYDAYLGSGSTMVACHQLNRKCYGMELDPKYCKVIIDRMKKLDPDIVIKKNGVEI